MSDDEIFEINDFSTATDWERFIADLEEILTQWNLGGTQTDDISGDDDQTAATILGSPKSAAISATDAALSSKQFSDTRLWIKKQEQLKFGKVTFQLTYHAFSANKSNVKATLDDERDGIGVSKSKDRQQSSSSGASSRAWRDMNEINHDWVASGHPLVRYYGLSQYLLLCPLKGETIATEDRIRHLLGSAATALGNINCEVPFFCQICALNRRLFSGVLNLNDGFRTYFDMIQYPEVPQSFQYVSNLTALFKKKLHAAFSYSSAARDKTIAATDGTRIVLSIRFTYLLPLFSPQYLLFNGNAPNHPSLQQFGYFRAEFSVAESAIRPISFAVVANQYSDPLVQLQLATTWPLVSEELITDSAYHSDLNPRNAPRWSLRALFLDRNVKSNQLCHSSEWLRMFITLRYRHKSAILLHLCHQEASSTASASQLTASSDDADDHKRSSEDVRSALDRLASPSDQLLTNVSRNVFGHLERNFLFSNDMPKLAMNVDDRIRLVFEKFEDDDASRSAAITANLEYENEINQLKSAPIGSLTWRIALLMANSFAEQQQIGAVAMIWKQFIAKLRWHWQNCRQLPFVDDEQQRRQAADTNCINYGHCLLHQKLEMLNCCIRQKIKRERSSSSGSIAAGVSQDTTDTATRAADHVEEDADEEDEFFDCDAENEDEKEDQQQSEVADDSKIRPEGQLEMLLDSSGNVIYYLDQPQRPIFVPVTQDPAPMTEDHHHRQMQTLAAMNASGTAEDAKLKIRLQSAGLISDMEAFKAANPGARFEDFIRWHSPRDWIEMDAELIGGSGENRSQRYADQKEQKLTPQFGLSRRMRDSPLWSELWSLARPVPVSRQKRLFNYTKEAEEILQHFRSITVNQLIEMLGPILSKAALGQILQFRAEIHSFVAQHVPNVDADDRPLSERLIPLEFDSFCTHFTRNDFDGLCEELTVAEYEIVKFFSLLKKFIFAYESEMKKPFKDLYSPDTAPATVNALPEASKTNQNNSVSDQRRTRPNRGIKIGVSKSSSGTNLNTFQKGDLIRFVTRLMLHDPDVQFANTDCISTLIVRLYADSVRFQYESATSVGDRLRTGPDSDDEDADANEQYRNSETKPAADRKHQLNSTLLNLPQLPPPTGKEFIFRVQSFARPAPYSRPSSQRLYCLMSPKNDFRIATAFTEDIAYF